VTAATSAVNRQRQSRVGGYLRIQQGGTFVIGPGSAIKASPQIQNLPSSTGQNQVCRAEYKAICSDLWVRTYFLDNGHSVHLAM
jgi:hypothetical protein